MATATKKNPADKARSAVVGEIYANLDRRKWTSRLALVAACAHLIPTAAAIKLYDSRIGHDVGKREKVAGGRYMRVMLDCITLLHRGKIEQRGRGPSKEYRLL